MYKVSFPKSCSLIYYGVNYIKHTSLCIQNVLIYIIFLILTEKSYNSHRNHYMFFSVDIRINQRQTRWIRIRTSLTMILECIHAQDDGYAYLLWPFYDFSVNIRINSRSVCGGNTPLKTIYCLYSEHQNQSTPMTLGIHTLYDYNMSSQWTTK